MNEELENVQAGEQAEDAPAEVVETLAPTEEEAEAVAAAVAGEDDAIAEASDEGDEDEGDEDEGDEDEGDEDEGDEDEGDEDESAS